MFAQKNCRQQGRVIHWVCREEGIGKGLWKVGDFHQCQWFLFPWRLRHLQGNHTYCSWLAEVIMGFCFPGDKQVDGHDPGWIKDVTALTIWWWRESWCFLCVPIVAEMSVSSLLQNLNLNSDQVCLVQPFWSWSSGSPCLEVLVGGVPAQLLHLFCRWRLCLMHRQQKMLSAGRWLSDTVKEVSPVLPWEVSGRVVCLGHMVGGYKEQDSPDKGQSKPSRMQHCCKHWRSILGTVQFPKTLPHPYASFSCATADT